MAKKKTDAMSLAIKNGDSSTLDLFMKSPENIKDFTNWQDKTSSLELDRARAFEKTPFEVDSDEFPDYDNIEISGDVAIASVPDYSPVVAGNWQNVNVAYRIRTVIDPNNDYNSDMKVDEGRESYSPLFFPIGTIANQSEMHFDAIQHYRESGLGFGGIVTNQLGITPRELKYFLRFHDTEEDVKFTLTTPMSTATNDALNSMNIVEVQQEFAKTFVETGMFPKYKRGSVLKCGGEGKVPQEIQGGAINLFGDTSFDQFGRASLGSGTSFFAVGITKEQNSDLNRCSGTASKPLFTYSVKGHGQADSRTTVTVYVDQYILQGSVATKLQHIGAGRVDHFVRRTGNVSSISVSDDTINLGVSTLQNGDLIKITSALESVAYAGGPAADTDSIHELNGLHYVKKSGSSAGSYELYSEPNLTNRLVITDSRGVDKINWTLLKSADNESPTSNWAYSHSDIGLNISGQKFQNDQVLSRVTPYATLLQGGYENRLRLGELEIADSNFRLGHAIAINSDGVKAISQPGNDLVALKDMRFYGLPGAMNDYDAPELGSSVDPNNLVTYIDSAGTKPFIEVSETTGAQPRKLEIQVYDVCQTTSETDDDPAEPAPDDPTGTTYGEDESFETPMSEPVVSTDGDDVDFYNYGDGMDDFEDPDIPDTTSSPDPGVAKSRDAVYEIYFPYVFRPQPLLRTTPGNYRASKSDRGGESGAFGDGYQAWQYLFNYGCVWVGDEGLVVTAATQNDYISPHPNLEFTAMDDFYWHKVYAQKKYGNLNDLYARQLVGFEGLAFGVISIGKGGRSTLGSGLIGGIGGSATRLEVFDTKIYTREVDSNLWKYPYHGQSYSRVRSQYLADFNAAERFTDGFGVAITLSDDNTLYAADQVNHFGTAFSYYTDLMLFDYDFVKPNPANPEYIGISDAQSNESNSAVGMGNFGIMPDESIRTKRQFNAPLQFFAERHTKPYKDIVTPHTFSIHIKKILSVNPSDGFSDSLLERSIQLIPYEFNPSPEEHPLNASEPLTRPKFRGYGVPSMVANSNKLMLSNGDSIKVLNIRHSTVYAMRRANHIVGNFTSVLQTQYKTLEKALKDPRIYPQGSDLWGAHQYMFLKSGNPSATIDDINYGVYYGDKYDSRRSPIFKMNPFFGGLMQGVPLYHNPLINPPIPPEGFRFDQLKHFFYVQYNYHLFDLDYWHATRNDHNSNIRQIHTPTDLSGLTPLRDSSGEPVYIGSLKAGSMRDVLNQGGSGGLLALKNPRSGPIATLRHYDFGVSYVPNVKSEFRANDNILAYLDDSPVDEFNMHALPARRLVLYDLSGDRPEFIQRITAAIPGYGQPNAEATFNLNESTTEGGGILDFSGFDIAGGKIFASIKNESYPAGNFESRILPSDRAYAIFSDTGRTPLPRSVPLGQFTEPMFPFFSFVEDFSEATAYDLNSVYEYIKNEGTFTNSATVDINNSHRTPVIFYSIRNFSKKGQVLTVPTNISFDLTVDYNNSTSGALGGDAVGAVGLADGPRVLPRIGLYNRDPRLTIRQAGQVSGSDLVYGQESSDLAPLYFGGVQNDENLSFLIPSYRFVGGRYIGAASIESTNALGENDLNKRNYFMDHKLLSSDDNRTFRYNDGTGKALTDTVDAFGVRIPTSYQLEFDDVNKETYNRSFHKSGKVLAISLLSWNDEWRAPPRAANNSAPYDDGVEAYRKAYNNVDHNEDNPHSFINYATVIANVTYQEYDLARIRRFACDGNWYLLDQPDPDAIDNALFNAPELVIDDPVAKASGFDKKIPGTLDLVRAGVGSADPHLNESVGVLLGTESNSIQVISPQLAFDLPKPEFLPLMINSIPVESGNRDLFTRGHIAESGNIDLHISGVRLAYNFAPLHLGEVVDDNKLDLVMSDVIGFECDGLALAMIPPTGTHREATIPLTFIGGTGVNEGLNLSINPTYTSGAFDLYVQGGLSSGNIDVAFSGVHGISNSMPCVEGQLFVGGMTGNGTGAMPLHINRFDASGDMPLFMEPGNASGLMPLTINTEPISSTGTLFFRGHESVTTDTSLFIGRQVAAKDADLFVSGPVTFEGDPITLHASGSVIPSINSIANNYSHSCELLRTENRFDFSNNSETVIPETKSNSISRNKHVPISNFRYGYYAPSKVGKTLTNYRNDAINTFYDRELSRDAIGSNDNYLAVATNVSALSNIKALQVFQYSDEDSLSLKFEYNKVYEDLSDLGLLGEGDTSLLLRYKSVAISENNRIAISARISTPNGLRDLVAILQPATLTKTRYGTPTFDLCAIEPSFTVPVTVEDIDGWVMTDAVLSDLIDQESSVSKSNNYLGNTIQWKDEDLYYDKQSTDSGDVYKLKLSDAYDIETKVFSFRTLSDGVRYKENRFNLADGIKVGFGAKFKIDGDYAAVSAPLLDPYVVNTDLSVIHGNAPEGAVYIYKYDGSSWSHIESLYAGGYVSSNISGTTSCGYNYKLFGYGLDLNAESGYVAVSEPGTNTIYKFAIHENDTASLIANYTDSTSSRFGSSVNICSNSILTNDIQFIKDPVYDYSFEFTPTENVAEVAQYNSESARTISVSSQFTFVKIVRPFGVPKLLAGRTFKVRFAGRPELTVEKISILDIRHNSGNLFISAPTLSSGDQDLLYHRPFESGTNTMGLQFASIGVNSGIPLHVHVPNPASGDFPLHLRQAEKFETTLFLGATFTDTTLASTLNIAGPSATTFESDAFVGGTEFSTNDKNLYVFGGEAAQRGADMFVQQRDAVSSSEAIPLAVYLGAPTGVGPQGGAQLATTTFSVEGGIYSPSDKLSTLVIKTDSFGIASGIAPLAISVDSATGVLDSAADISISGAGTSTTVGARRDNANNDLIIAATAPANSGVNLVVYRKGIGGGEELDANTNLIVYNLTESSNVDLAVSGANITVADMNIAISGVVGLGTGIMPTFVRGYQD